MSRRSYLKTLGAMAGGAAAYKLIEKFGLPALAQPGGSVTDSATLGQAHAALGDWVYLTPQKLGGGTHCCDMGTGKTLAWISYWNYGDTCPISHHLAAYPSSNPKSSFEFVNSTQGGMNVMIYGLPTQIKSRGILERYGQGNNIYRVQYDSQQMNLMENIAESTGLGLGVHTTILPDASGFACADGQKDVCAFFDRAKGYDKTKVLQSPGGLEMAYRADWMAKEKREMDKTWSEGGTLRFSRILPSKETLKYEYEGCAGNKIDWEMVPMAESLVWDGRIPGDSPRTLTGLDAVVHQPDTPYSAIVLRMLASALIIDRRTGVPVTCLHTPKGSPNNLPVTKYSTSPETWEVKYENIRCVAHEAGFTPDGRNFAMMNNLKQNNMAVFETSDPDPQKWKSIAYVEDPSWVGSFPCPFHLCFSMDGRWMYVSVLDQKPKASDSVVVDTKTWKIVHSFKKVGPDCQTMAVTYDGKYVLQIFSGFQRLSSGVFIYTQQPDKKTGNFEPIGYLPNFGGHHDCVIIPRNERELLNSRCTTL